MGRASAPNRRTSRGSPVARTCLAAVAACHAFQHFAQRAQLDDLLLVDHQNARRSRVLHMG
jgi:hypothetical protein